MGSDATGFEIAVAAGAILLSGAALGAVNAGLIRGVKIPSIIATLATLSIVNGIALTMRPTAQGVINGEFVSFLKTSIGPIPVSFLIVLAAVGLADLWLHGTGSGLDLRATGFDERSAKRGGVPTTWVRVRALLLSGVLAAMASFFVIAAQSPVGNAQIGAPYTLRSITAAVLGGAAIAGGARRSSVGPSRRSCSHSS